MGRPVGGEYAPEGGSGLLSLGQKRNLVALARRAWRARGCPGVSFDAWRTSEAISACGLRISEALQRDWGSLRARFQDAAGESGAAFNTLVRDEDNKRRVALWKLQQICSKVGVPLAYPEAICRRQYRCALPEATPAQLWRLFFTVKNRKDKSNRKDTSK